MTEQIKMKIVKNSALSQENGPDFLMPEATVSAQHLHRTVEGYQETPLVNLSTLADKLGVKGIYVKDESYRFGLKAFKGLGGIYALTKVICEKFGLDIETVSFSDLKEPSLNRKISEMVFVTATDGNHGKGVAWAAGQLGCKAYVYMPKGSSELRAQAIRDAGKAEVTITELCYDDAVRYAKEMSEKHGWTLIQDTSWDGYETIPTWIIQGYTTMVREAVRQLEGYGVTAPTHVFLQAGVGAMAGGVTGFLVNYYRNNRPVISIVEPDEVSCILESAQQRDGKPHAATGSGVTIMAGLNCGEPCTVTWPILRDFVSFYLACPDFVAAEGMRRLAFPLGTDKKIIAGESGAATAGAVLMLLDRPECAAMKEQIGLDENSVILLFNTEGDTDPDSYRSILAGAYPLP